MRWNGLTYVYIMVRDTFDVCCNYIIITLIYNYNVMCVINMTLNFGFHDFWDIPYFLLLTDGSWEIMKAKNASLSFKHISMGILRTFI
jgi:hypothetical protein